jgi:hypothetical protein
MVLLEKALLRIWLRVASEHSPCLLSRFVKLRLVCSDRIREDRLQREPTWRLESAQVPTGAPREAFPGACVAGRQAHRRALNFLIIARDDGGFRKATGLLPLCPGY